MLAVLMSMKPEWWEKILAGEKTLEIRKTHPQNERLEWPVTSAIAPTALVTSWLLLMFCLHFVWDLNVLPRHGRTVQAELCQRAGRVELLR